MKITIVGDFADPMSFLASQRVEQIRSLGLLDVEWLAVETDRVRPMTGRVLAEADSERVRQLALPGEAIPAEQLRVPNSRAATAAYAESFGDGVPEAMRVALFDGLWVSGRNIADPGVIRSIAFRVLNPDPPGGINARIRANQPIVPLGDVDPIVTTRRLGFVVSMGRGPLTLEGSRRVDAMRRVWADYGEPVLPLLITDARMICSGEQALRWLADRLPHRAPERDGEHVAPITAGSVTAGLPR